MEKKHKCVDCKHFVNRVRGKRGGTMGMCELSDADEYNYYRQAGMLRYSNSKPCKRFEMRGTGTMFDFFGGREMLRFKDLDNGDFFMFGTVKLIKLSDACDLDQYGKKIPIPLQKPNCINTENLHYCTVHPNVPVKVVKKIMDFVGE